MFHALLGFVAFSSGSPGILDKVDEVCDELFKILFGKKQAKHELDPEAVEKFKEFGDKYAFRIRSDILQQQNIGKPRVAKAVFSQGSDEEAEYF